MQFEFEPHTLIAQVKKRRGLWDLKSLEHSSRKRRIELWQEVAETLNKNHLSCTKSERREIEFQLQKKWKSLRDSFLKYLNNPGKSRKPYIYFKQLQFLHEGERLPQSSDSDTNDTSSVTWTKKKVISFNSPSSDDEVIASNNDAGCKIEMEESSEPSHSFVFADVEPEPIAAFSKQSTTTDDHDRLFLLSLLPYLKAIPESEKLKVKMTLMTVLHNSNSNTK